MKLIDLLVQELPKRGGWPDGAESVVQDADDSEFYFFTGGAVKNSGESWWFVDSDNRNDNSKWIFFGGKNDVADDCNSAIVTRAQYESALAALQKPAWNGEGLPPVGCEVEYISNGVSWGKVKVIGFDGEKIVIRPSGEIYYAITPSNKDVFIPLRTEADKKRDAALDAIYGAIASAKREHNRSDEADEVYKAIAAGKIPGVKLDD
ncbi:TPA: hypothetical protein ACW5FR_001695 [Salmonella enterica]